MSRDDDSAWPSRAEKRYLRRIYNGRTTPLIADGQKFLTYKQAMAHLRSLDEAACHAVVEQMKSAAKAEKALPDTP